MARPRNAAAAIAQTMADDGFPLPEAEIPAAPQRTPARQRLADAIVTDAAIRAEIAEATAAIGEATERRFAAASALRAAEAALRHVMPRPRQIGDSYMPPTFGTEEAFNEYQAATAAPPISIEDARAAVAKATDAHDSEVRTIAWHEQRHAAAAERLRYKRNDIAEAALAVVRSDPALAALAAATRRAVTRAESALAAMRAATGGVLIPLSSPLYGYDKPAPAVSSPNAMADWGVSREWHTALDALATDPDAPLPAPM